MEASLALPVEERRALLMGLLDHPLVTSTTAIVKPLLYDLKNAQNFFLGRLIFMKNLLKRVKLFFR